MKILSRRTLLRGAGGVGIALPFLDAMWSGRARAAAATPKRFFVMTGVNGVVLESWFPTGTEKDFKLGASMAALEPFKANLIIPDGITKMQRGTTDGTAHGRGAASAVSGWTSSGKNGIPDGASIDQVLANAIGGSSRIKSLITGNKAYNYYFFADGPKQVHPIEPDPKKNFDRLFTGFTPPAAGAPVGPAPADADLAKLRARDKSILDAAMEQYTKVAQKVGVGDRQRLDKHLSAIRQVETQLGNATTGNPEATKSCSKPDGPGMAGMDPYQSVGKANMDLCALAFACDLTRVAGFQWISHNQVFSWLGANQQHHPLSHAHGSAGVDAQLTKIIGWHAEQAAAFLTQLKGYSEGEGTVFDNTLFMWTSEQSIGSHKFDRGPFLIAAGKFPLASGGTLQTGRYLKYSGNPHTSVLQSITMAVANIKMPVFPAWDKGPLPNLLTA